MRLYRSTSVFPFAKATDIEYLGVAHFFGHFTSQGNLPIGTTKKPECFVLAQSWIEITHRIIGGKFNKASWHPQSASNSTRLCNDVDPDLTLSQLKMARKNRVGHIWQQEKPLKWQQQENVSGCPALHICALTNPELKRAQLGPNLLGL